jgi:hypothetical protein
MHCTLACYIVENAICNNVGSECPVVGHSDGMKPAQLLCLKLEFNNDVLHHSIVDILVGLPLHEELNAIAARKMDQFHKH